MFNLNFLNDFCHFVILSYDGTISHDISLLSSDDSGTYKRMDEDRMEKIHILDMTYVITALKLYEKLKNCQNIH